MVNFERLSSSGVETLMESQNTKHKRTKPSSSLCASAPTTSIPGNARHGINFSEMNVFIITAAKARAQMQFINWLSNW